YRQHPHRGRQRRAAAGRIQADTADRSQEVFAHHAGGRLHAQAVGPLRLVEDLDAADGRRHGLAHRGRYPGLCRGELRLAHLETLQCAAVELPCQRAQGGIAVTAHQGDDLPHARHQGLVAQWLRTRQRAGAAGAVQGIPVDEFHASTWSTAITIIPRAPSWRSASRCDQSRLRWHRAWMLIWSGWPSRPSTTGAWRAGSRRVMGGSAERGACSTSRRAWAPDSAPSMRACSRTASSSSSGASPRGVRASTASLSSTVATSRSWLAASVAPVETRSQTASALPRRGAISTEPLSVTTSACTPCRASQRPSRAGYEVAMRRPPRSAGDDQARSCGTAMARRQWPKPSEATLSG